MHTHEHLEVQEHEQVLHWRLVILLMYQRLQQPIHNIRLLLVVLIELRLLTERIMLLL